MEGSYHLKSIKDLIEDAPPEDRYPSATLFGAASRGLMEQAEGMPDPTMRASARKVALGVSDRERQEAVEAGRRAAFARVPLWAYYLPISRRQAHVLGRVYSFQCTTSKDGEPGEYRMSLAAGARELHMDSRVDLQRDLKTLLRLGYVTKLSNGPRRPASYIVDVAACVIAARANGWEG